jgi:hypothetical protein
VTEPSGDDVLRRWNPDDWARLHGDTPAPRVRIAAVAGSGEDDLLAELGELGAGHVEYVRDGSAAVVLMVLEASACVGRTELAVLADAGHGVARVVCALTGIERCPGWRRVLDNDLALLQRHAGLLDVTILPVATTLAVHAREMGGDAGHVLRLESGIVDLHEMLRAAVAAHTVTVARSAVIARTRRMIAETVEELRADDDASLRAERARLVQQAAAPTDPGGRARSDLQRARLELLQEVAAGVRAIASAVRDAVDADPTRAPGLLDAAARQLNDRISAIVAVRLGESVTAPLRAPTPMASATGTVEERLAVVLGASAGAGLGRLLAFPLEALPAAHLATVPITVAGGLGAAWWLVRVRRRLAARDRARRWVTDALTEIRADLDTWVLARIVDAEARAAATAAAEHTARLSALHDRVTALDEELRRRLGERNARIEACRRDLAALDRSNRPRTTEPRAVPARPTL